MQLEGMLSARNAELKQAKIKLAKLKKKMKKEISKMIKYYEEIQPKFSAIWYGTTVCIYCTLHMKMESQSYCV